MVDVLEMEIRSEAIEVVDVLEKIVKIVKVVRENFNIEGVRYEEVVAVYPSEIRIKVSVTIKEEEVAE